MSTWGPDSSVADVEAKLFDMMKTKFGKTKVTRRTAMDKLTDDFVEQVDFDLDVVKEFGVESDDGVVTISETAGGYVDWVMGKLQAKGAS